MSESNILIVGDASETSVLAPIHKTIRPNTSHGVQAAGSVASPFNPMIDVSSVSASAQSEVSAEGQVNQDLFLDGQSLQQIKLMDDKNVALQQIAEQFEAIFLQQMLKTMRAASSALADEENPLTAQKDSMYQDMMDSQLALDMSKSNGIGIAEMLVKQLATS